MAKQGPGGRDQTVVMCGNFITIKTSIKFQLIPNFNAIVIGDMMSQLINPFVKEDLLQN